jgi:hypothetical protein
MTTGIYLFNPRPARQPRRLDAGGSRWRLRSLQAMGHPSAAMARAMGVHSETVRRLVRGGAETASPELAKAVSLLFDAWWDKRPPERTREERQAAEAARRRAARCGWPAGLALDEDLIDVPGYRPTARWRPATGVGVAEDYPSIDTRARRAS